MKLAVVVYVFIAFLVNTNAPATIPVTDVRSWIKVFNICSLEREFFVSSSIGYDDGTLYMSPILGTGENSYFPHANTTTGLNITIFKHINAEEFGTVIITKKVAGDENHCFSVSGEYWVPKLLNCLERISCVGDNNCKEDVQPFFHH